MLPIHLPEPGHSLQLTLLLLCLSSASPYSVYNTMLVPEPGNSGIELRQELHCKHCKSKLWGPEVLVTCTCLCGVLGSPA